jgi:hypothetical protein
MTEQVTNYVFPLYTTPEERASAAAADKRIVQAASNEPVAKELRATTLIVVGVREVNGQRFEHGAELPPGLLSREVIDQWLDQKRLSEHDVAERRSLYRLFHLFSDCDETEPFTRKELDAYALQP